MQTLMEDYETHKVKRREKMDDNSVSIYTWKYNNKIVYNKTDDKNHHLFCIKASITAG